MRLAFVHEWLLALPSGADAPGAAVARALCGGGVQETPRPICSHHNATVSRPDRVASRTLFVADADPELTVRVLIEAALAAGEAGGDGIGRVGWYVRGSHRSVSYHRRAGLGLPAHAAPIVPSRRVTTLLWDGPLWAHAVSAAFSRMIKGLATPVLQFARALSLSRVGVTPLPSAGRRTVAGGIGPDVG